MRGDLEDRRQAETLLYEIATRLRALPFEEHTSCLHLRALALKRATANWTDREPDDAERRAVFDEIRSLELDIRSFASGSVTQRIVASCN
jgi:hypothetical protein